MAAYDYRCRTCDSTFEVRRPVTASADLAGVRCPAGHADATRVWSAVSVATGAGIRAEFNATARPTAPSGGGGCCGGACGCG